MQSLFFGKSKKGMAIGDLGPVALVVGIAVLIVAIVANILTDMNATQTADSYAANITTKGLTGMETIGNNVPTIALVVASAIVIGVLVRSFQAK